jgi:hypothetical protein
MLVATQGKERAPILEANVYPAACAMVVDLGTQHSAQFATSRHQVCIIWEVAGETVEINGETLPRHIGKYFTLSLDERSNLRKILQSWRGKPFDAEELKGFDLKNVLGKPCQLQVIHKSGERGTYATVDAIMAMSRGMVKPEASGTVFFDMSDRATYESFEALPRYLMEKIAQADEFAATGLKLPERTVPGVGDPPPETCYTADFDEIPGDDTIPF